MNHRAGTTIRLKRRTVLQLLAVSGVAALMQACSNSAPPTSPAPTVGPTTGAAPAQPLSASGSADWDTLLAAARAEGMVSVNTFPGSANQTALATFAQAYPDIKLEQTTLVSSALAPRIVQEHQAGIYTWDVIHQPTTTSLQVLKPAGILDPIKPAIVHPQVVDDKVWRDGFAAGFSLTNDAQLCYQSTLVRAQNLMIDTDQVAPNDLNSAQDLLDPKWKGRIACTDTRISGSTFFPFTLPV
jgi:hypothetical protein